MGVEESSVDSSFRGTRQGRESICLQVSCVLMMTEAICSWSLKYTLPYYIIFLHCDCYTSQGLFIKQFFYTPSSKQHSEELTSLELTPRALLCFAPFLPSTSGAGLTTNLSAPNFIPEGQLTCVDPNNPFSAMCLREQPQLKKSHMNFPGSFSKIIKRNPFPSAVENMKVLETLALASQKQIAWKNWDQA